MYRDGIYRTSTLDERENKIRSIATIYRISGSERRNTSSETGIDATRHMSTFFENGKMDKPNDWMLSLDEIQIRTSSKRTDNTFNEYGGVVNYVDRIPTYRDKERIPVRPVHAYRGLGYRTEFVPT